MPAMTMTVRSGMLVRSLFLLALQSLLCTAAALQLIRSTARGARAFATSPPALPSRSTIARNACSRPPAPPPLTLSARRNSAASSSNRSALGATVPFSGNSAEALFPSDDSDYELTAESYGKSKKDSVAEPNARAIINNERDDDDAVSELNGFARSRMNLDDELSIIVDPIDVIANWVAGRFVEQSLQHSGENEGNGNAQLIDGTDDDDRKDSSENYIMESYPPGSGLDVVAQMTSTYTPLSYQIRTLVRTVLPSIFVAIVAKELYPSAVQWIAHLHTGVPSTPAVGDSADGTLLYTDQVLTVLSNDLSQYVQNILTTCALLFSLIVGQTYYFMYQQQELVFYALFAEVTEAKSLLEQISLMTYGRPKVYNSLLSRMNDYVLNDLKLLSVKDPIAVTSRLPKDDPLESILYATSVGLPGVVYETVKSLRQARATRCGALQRKLPAVHVYCLRLLGVIVLTTFPVCGSGSQAIAPNVLILQSYLFGILAFGLTLVLNVVEELRNSRTKMGAYNVDGILEVMVGGLEQELEERLEGKFWGVGISPGLPAGGGIGGEGVVEVGSSGGSVVWAAEDKGMVARFRGDIAGGLISCAEGGKDAAPASPRRRGVRKWLHKHVLRRQ